MRDLPALDSLTRDSDFSPFMREGVPEELRNQALRKLWSSDPVYANLDGLLEYGEDFGEPFRMAGVVATVYRVLEGMPDPQLASKPPSNEPPKREPPESKPSESKPSAIAEDCPSDSSLGKDRASFETATSPPPREDGLS